MCGTWAGEGKGERGREMSGYGNRWMSAWLLMMDFFYFDVEKEEEYSASGVLRCVLLD